MDRASNTWRIFAAVLVTAIAVPAYAENAKERLQEATGVLNELMGAEDKGIPKD